MARKRVLGVLARCFHGNACECVEYGMLLGDFRRCVCEPRATRVVSLPATSRIALHALLRPLLPSQTCSELFIGEGPNDGATSMGTGPPASAGWGSTDAGTTPSSDPLAASEMLRSSMAMSSGTSVRESRHWFGWAGCSVVRELGSRVATSRRCRGGYRVVFARLCAS
jgi:hypothetical protein